MGLIVVLARVPGKIKGKKWNIIEVKYFFKEIFQIFNIAFHENIKIMQYKNNLNRKKEQKNEKHKYVNYIIIIQWIPPPVVTVKCG